MQEIEKYEAKYNPEQKAEAERIRKIVHAAAPQATQELSYGVPAFRYNNRLLIGYSAFKDHYSLFPGSITIAQYKDELKDYECSKGTIKYTQDNLISADLVTKLVVAGKKSLDESKLDAN